MSAKLFFINSFSTKSCTSSTVGKNFAPLFLFIKSDCTFNKVRKTLFATLRDSASPPSPVTSKALKTARATISKSKETTSPLLFRTDFILANSFFEIFSVFFVFGFINLNCFRVSDVNNGNFCSFSFLNQQMINCGR